MRGFGIVWCGAFVLSGACSSGPAIPAVVDPAGGALDYSIDEWKRDRSSYEVWMADYRRSGAPKDLQAASSQRDLMVNRVRADIRSFHADYEAALTEGIAHWNIFGDLTQLALALASTVTKGKETKTILSAVIAATAGAKLSVDKNYFREKTSEVLISSLRTARLEKDTVIVGKLSSMKADEYPLEEALCDLVDLHYAGTLTEAFQRLAQQAGTDAEQAEEKAELLNVNRAELLRVTKEQIVNRRAITAAIDQLQGAPLAAMLTAMQVTVAANADEPQKRRALKDEFRRQTSDKPADDPIWQTWGERLAEARRAGGQ